MPIHKLALVAMLVFALPSPSAADEAATQVALGPSQPVHHEGVRRCAAFDLHVLWLIEEHGDAREVSDDEIIGASGRLNAARGLCAAGRIAEALEVYSTIPLVQPRSRWFR